MTKLDGLTKENCAAACNADGCVLADGRPFCLHPCKGGAPKSVEHDLEIQNLQAEARDLLGVKKNVLQGAA